jgi:hypothetical protein
MAGTVAGKGATERPHKIDGMHLCFSACAYLLKNGDSERIKMQAI